MKKILLYSMALVLSLVSPAFASFDDVESCGTGSCVIVTYNPITSHQYVIMDLSFTTDNAAKMSNTILDTSSIFMDNTGTSMAAAMTAKANASLMGANSGIATLTSGGKLTATQMPTVSYTDLTNKPTIPAAQVSSDWNASTGIAQILNKPTLFSGAYVDLTGKPTIPAAQVNSDWNASTGVAQILNKPTIPSAFAVGSPNSRSLSLATAYQCTDTSKPCSLTVSMTCPLSLSLISTQTCTGEVRIGSANTVAGGTTGTVIAPITRSASGVIGLATNDVETKTITIPAGWYFAIRQTASPAGAITIPAAFDQSLGN